MDAKLFLLGIVAFAAINSTSSSKGTRIEASDIEKFVNKKTRIQDENPIKIGAFNIQFFRNSKTANEAVMEIILKIIVRYDVILIQEVLDDTAAKLKEYMDKKRYRYEFVASKKHGSSPKYQEQYLFLIRPRSGLHLEKGAGTEGTYEFEDKLFERPPFSIKISSDRLGFPFVLTALHTKPTKAKAEIQSLFKVVVPKLYEVMNTTDILIMGDLNTDQILLNQVNNIFYWPLPDDLVTTVCSSNPYDRFIIIGEQLNNSLVPGSAGVYKFDMEFSLTCEKARAVSDHYPIELTLKPALQEMEAEDKIKRPSKPPISKKITKAPKKTTRRPLRYGQKDF